ncbi:TonB-dependent receptor [Rheinheimera sp. F8]|uniref:TonB-dependent receptor n=1 Tax=Rheinheimera sp. F8 TaxID=1763998 RepID=UPI000744A556|nr:TonB-dependent receptor [Rheinheimera sp. F8]ALZ76091.1 cell envelope biogenesis protein OmpA [Rheinheimera sp. F8]ALZ77728.1 cell envelope biogenesis protein OmpA [Rheinheimera sp. F8]
MKIRHIAMAVAVALGSSYASADTSSAIRGRISNPEGAAAAGTKVIILHVPSGTSRTVVTNESGNFVASGLRVGGPYKVTVDSDTYNDETVSDVFLQLGDTYQLNRQLQSASVERIAVTGAAIATSSSGAASYFGADQIEKSPSLNRDIKDMVRNNPLAVVSPGNNNELSVAGMNPRFNSINIDGIAQNDDFGLNSNGYPTQRPPISMDAIDQISIETSPFNAKASGFQGALIDAVTKSGTNDTAGSVMFEFMNDSMAGTPYSKLTNREVPLDYNSKTFGATLGGAIVEDKLFFFTAVEKFENKTLPIWGPKGSGSSNEAFATQASYDEVIRIAKEVYGQDAGSWDFTPIEDDEKLLIKLDWNMNDMHRSALTYQYNKGNKTENTTTSRNLLRMSSNWYNKEETLNNFAYKLYSDWNSDFSTQLSATYMQVDTVQASLNSAIGDVTIKTIPGATRNTEGNIGIGSDTSRHSNDLRKKILILAADGDYLLDEHHLTFGYQLKRSDIYNLFLQNTKGSYEFASLADFAARRAKVNYRNTFSGDPSDAAASFVRDEHALYLQDEWAVSDELTLDLGVRYERLSSNDVPALNTAFVKRNGLENTENLDGIDILLPRFGFTYNATVDLTLRGGVGRFSGGQPTVWVSNSYSNTGVGVGDTGSLSSSPVYSNVDLSRVPQALIDAVSGRALSADVNFVDPNYELPSDWRAQLAADYIFEIPGIGEDFQWSTEYMFMRKQDDSYWKDIALDVPGRKTGTILNGLMNVYSSNSALRRDIMLTNTDLEAESKILSTTLSKEWESGIRSTFSYTNQDVEDVHVSTSSTASSNFGNNIVVNRNDAILGRSTFETKHRFVLSLDYSAEFISGYPTNFNMFFERRSGRPVTYIMNNLDMDDQSGNGGTNGPLRNPGDFLSPLTTNSAFLAYIPTSENDPAIRFFSAQDKTLFMERVKALGLDRYAGGFAPKGAGDSPWVSSMDVSIRQELPGFTEGDSGTFYVTITNFLNLLNDDWGQVYGTRFGSINLMDASYDPNTKQLVYRAPDINTTPNVHYSEFFAPESTYRIKVGVSYRF